MIDRPGYLETLVQEMADIEKRREILLELSEYRMPFGKYSGRRLVDLPEPYVVWFSQNGFPPGKLGELMQLVYEIKVNGLEYLFEPLVKNEKKKS